LQWRVKARISAAAYPFFIAAISAFAAGSSHPTNNPAAPHAAKTVKAGSKPIMEIVRPSERLMFQTALIFTDTRPL
jgi:hypothetical protein